MRKSNIRAAQGARRASLISDNQGTKVGRRGLTFLVDGLLFVVSCSAANCLPLTANPLFHREDQ
jgi:hypothetical protein